MTQQAIDTSIAPFDELNVETPPHGWVFVRGKLVVVWCQNGIHGVAYWKHKLGADKVLAQMGGEFKSVRVTIKQAAKLAKEKAQTTPCRAVMLMDVEPEPFPVYVLSDSEAKI